MYACTGGMLEAEHVDLRAHVEQEREPRVVADLGGEVQQRRAALGDAVDVDDRLLQQNLQHAEVAVLQRELERGAVGRVAQMERRARVKQQLDHRWLARLGAQDERRCPRARARTLDKSEQR